MTVQVHAFEIIDWDEEFVLQAPAAPYGPGKAIIPAVVKYETNNREDGVSSAVTIATGPTPNNKTINNNDKTDSDKDNENNGKDDAEKRDE